MDLERRQTMKPECNVNGHIIEYDTVFTKKNKFGDEEYIYIGSGTIHKVKGILQTDDRKMHFYHKTQ